MPKLLVTYGTSKGLGQRRAKGTTSRLGRPTPISNGGDEGCWWLGQAQQIQCMLVQIGGYHGASYTNEQT